MTIFIDDKRARVAATSHCAVFLLLYGAGLHRRRLPRLRPDLLAADGVGKIAADAGGAFSRPAVLRLDAVFRVPEPGSPHPARSCGTARWALIGVSLATAMTISGFLVAVNAMKRSAAVGMTDEGIAFAIVPLSGILFFAVVFTLAIANVRQPEIHKRLMLLAGISLLDAAVARWFLTFLAPPGAARPAAGARHHPAGLGRLSPAGGRDRATTGARAGRPHPGLCLSAASRWWR